MCPSGIIPALEGSCKRHNFDEITLRVAGQGGGDVSKPFVVDIQLRLLIGCVIVRVPTLTANLTLGRIQNGAKWIHFF
jgi:hypothetical protein